MHFSQLRLGIVSSSEERSKTLAAQVRDTGLAQVAVQTRQHCQTKGDLPTRQLIDGQVEVVLVDMDGGQLGITSLTILRQALPDAWLLVASPHSDPQLIIETMRAGAREFLSEPLAAAALSQALDRCVAEKRLTNSKNGQVYCVTTAKGGSGATSVAINLAASLAEHKHFRVSLIDLNSPVGDAAAYLNLRTQFTVSDALEAASRLDTVLLESFMTHSHGFSVLPGLRDFDPNPLLDTGALSRLLDVASQSYAYTIVDLPATLAVEQIQVAVCMSSAIVVVLTPELPALWRTDRLLRFLRANGAGSKVQILLNRDDKSSEIGGKEIESVLERAIAWRLPNNYSAAIQAINSGRPLVTANHSELARKYKDLAQQIGGIAPQTRTRFFGLLGRKQEVR
ncbi:MAG: hypothetical protein EHM61_00600 [Acidobacteria bacterium]|nr:MAG: hypothetical protein EHM61_00600 [Acidobacteriota bacterium]